MICLKFPTEKLAALNLANSSAYSMVGLHKAPTLEPSSDPSLSKSFVTTEARAQECYILEAMTMTRTSVNRSQTGV